MTAASVIAGTSIALNYVFMIGLVIAAVLGIIFIMSSRAIRMKAATGLIQTKPPFKPLQNIRKGKFLRRLMDQVQENTEALLKQADIAEFLRENCTFAMSFPQVYSDDGLFMTLPQQVSMATEICRSHKNTFGRYASYEDLRTLFRGKEDHQDVKLYIEMYERCLYGKPSEFFDFQALLTFYRLQQAAQKALTGVK